MMLVVSIYANPQAFFDITSGSNPGCTLLYFGRVLLETNFATTGNTNGFSAGTGWDPVCRFRLRIACTRYH